jgi:hypothetical protein
MCSSYSILYQRIGLDTSYIENAVQTVIKVANGVYSTQEVLLSKKMCL